MPLFLHLLKLFAFLYAYYMPGSEKAPHPKTRFRVGRLIFFDIFTASKLKFASSGKSLGSFSLKLEHCCQQQAYYKAGAEEVQRKAVAVRALINYG